MFCKGKLPEEYEGFSRRLYEVATMRDIKDINDLAEKLDKNSECKSLLNIRQRNREVPTNPLNAIVRNIQKHLNTSDPSKVHSSYMLAYSIVLDCSLDYLYGRSDIMSCDMEVADICSKTGLSEQAVLRLVERHDFDKDDECYHFSEWWSKFISSSFETFPMAWLAFSNQILEKNDLDKRISAIEKADADYQFEDSINQFLISEENQKTLRNLSRNKVDSIYGSFHKMMTIFEKELSEYAEAWADQQHPDYDLMYYHSEINKRKIIDSALKVTP